MKLSPIFTDGLIFQANKPIRIFGTGGGTLRISFGGAHYEADICAAEWLAELPPMPYGGPYELVAELDGRKTVLSDVYVGDVYLLAGQSNMQFKLRESNYPVEAYEAFPNMRLFSLECMATGEAFFPEDGWVKCTKENAGGWPCIGYIVGQELMKTSGHAIGFITCYQGAGAIQAFLPERVFEAEPSLIVPESERFDMGYPWNAGYSQLYNFMFRKVAPFSVSAVLWYQGESNCSVPESEIYERLLNALIDTWREDERDAALRFVIVQIADYLPRLHKPWKTIQAVQSEAAKRENVDTVISRDVCENDMIHPVSKTELAHRIAMCLE